jgi:two-component system nitrogen regulation sensor histidine kinase NtrY
VRSHFRLSGLGFRRRLFAFLLSFALVPSILLLLAWGAMTSWALPMVGATAAWDSVSASGQRAIRAARAEVRTVGARSALNTHESRLNEALLMTKRTSFLVSRAEPLALALIGVAILILALLAARAAGHLSRNMSRPLQELVEWTDLIARGDSLPTGPPRRGAPEFQLLRHRMQRMAGELRTARSRALEAERAAALRESARQVAHELKNPLTPIRFAVARLRAHATPETADAIEVLETESARLDTMARSFAQFGRLPEGPRAPVDLGELARYAARSSATDGVSIEVDVSPETPMISGYFDALTRAVSNVVLNAIDACGSKGTVRMHVRPGALNGRAAAEIIIEDTGRGIAPDKLPHVFEPYMTTKPGGTGLGLAIVRQTILAHDGHVDATSVPGQGTSIRLVLPVDAAPVPAPV